MFDMLAEQTETTGAHCTANSNTADTSTANTQVSASGRYATDTDDGQPSFRTINVLMIDTGDDTSNSSVIEQCLRYMTRFECRIALAGSTAAARFALQADTFDLVLANEHCLDLIAASTVPTIITTSHPCSETTRKALKAGALYCLPLVDLSPRLLETAVSQVLCVESAL
jgi:hypothetical protein